MNDADYQELMDRYLDGAISPREFQNLYLKKFKEEKRELPEKAFDILDTLFSDVDAFCQDIRLLAKLNRESPNYYLTEKALRQRVSEASERLREISIAKAQAGLL